MKSLKLFYYNYFNATKISLYTTLKAQSWQLPLYQQPYLHVTSCDEALVLDVTHLEELVGFLQDSILSHVPILTRTCLFAASLPLTCSPGHRGGLGIGDGTRSSKSCHDTCESVDTRAFPAPFTWARHRQTCGGKRSWRSGDSGCSTSEAPTNVTDCHLLATTSLISRWNLGERQEESLPF